MRSEIRLPARATRAATRAAALVGFTALLAAMPVWTDGRTADVEEADASLSPWDALTDSLRATGAAAAFDSVAALAASRAPAIRPPYFEAGRFGAGAEAVAFRVDLVRGEKLSVALELPDGVAPAFLEIDSGRVATPAPDSHLEHVAATDGTVLVRILPRPGTDADYTLRIDRTAALTFPVQHGGVSVLSFFRDPRDGGSRRHEGVDIGAPRGARVVAAADGIVERVDEGGAGGRVVWVREEETGRRHYYAHLETQAVRRGARVAAGDLIGTVGATGNAHESAPHLHFAVYQHNRALDPLDFLDPPDAAARRHDEADPALIGARARTRFAGAALRTVNRMHAPARPLPRHAELEIVAVSGRYYRVRTDAVDADGFLPAWLVEPLDREPDARRGLFRR